MENFRERKRYNLSLKKKITDMPQAYTTIDTGKKNEVPVVKKQWEEASDTMDSQNFNLRISDSFNLDDSEEIEKPRKYTVPAKISSKKEEDIIIVISDSSEEENSPQVRENNRFPSCIKTNHNKGHQSSINSIGILDEDEDIYTSSSTHNKDPWIQTRGKNRGSSEYSSDSTNFELQYDDDKNSIVESSLTIKTKEIVLNKEPVKCQTPKEKPFDALKNVKNSGTPGSAKLSTLTTPLSKKEAKNIMKIIKSQKIESPVVPKNHIIDETDSDVVTDEEPGRTPHPAWIAETESEDSPSPKPTKTHISRFLNPPAETTPSDDLSEQKKKEISLWLMNNSPNDRSDDSISNIPPSHTRTSASSGNSSLDRLEANYETPNNRKIFREKLNFKQLANNINSPQIHVNSPQLNKSTTPRQTVMDEYLKKTKTSVKSKKTYTPLPVVRSKTVAVSPAVDTPPAKIEDCADILDQLYGTAWRQKAHVILPKTEPRKNVKLTDRAVQTERIKQPKKIITSSGDSEENFETFVKNIKPNLNSTKKPSRGYKRDSFIVGSSESETSDGETTYMTALTNPRISDLQRNEIRQPPMSANTRKAIEICDSDSEDDATPVRHNVDNRRRLLFSDDEDEKSSGTSEYDPDDVVAPKSVLPKSVLPVKNLKTVKSVPKPPAPAARRPERYRSFLASLSATVPLEVAHPEAKKFRQNFKNTKDDLVKQLFKLYNEKIFDKQLPHDMVIEWNVRLRGTAGFCYNRKTKGIAGVVRTSRIALATKVLDTPDRLRDTLIHELCHAAAWIINHFSDGHGPFWKGWAAKAIKVFPELPPIKRCHDYKISTKYTYRCVQCGYSIGRHSKSLDIEKKRCGHCFGRFELLLNRVTKSGTKLQIPKTPNDKQPSAFAQFVKDHYSTIRKTRQGIPHKEVMQLLGQQFSAIKLSKKNNEERQSSEEIF